MYIVCNLADYLFCVTVTMCICGHCWPLHYWHGERNNGITCREMLYGVMRKKQYKWDNMTLNIRTERYIFYKIAYAGNVLQISLNNFAEENVGLKPVSRQQFLCLALIHSTTLFVSFWNIRMKFNTLCGLTLTWSFFGIGAIG